MDEPAEVEEQPLKHQDRPGAAEDGERLTGEQTEDATGDRRPQETLQHALNTPRGDRHGVTHRRNRPCPQADGG